MTTRIVALVVAAIALPSRQGGDHVVAARNVHLTDGERRAVGRMRMDDGRDIIAMLHRKPVKPPFGSHPRWRLKCGSRPQCDNLFVGTPTGKRQPLEKVRYRLGGDPLAINAAGPRMVVRQARLRTLVTTLCREQSRSLVNKSDLHTPSHLVLS